MEQKNIFEPSLGSVLSTPVFRKKLTSKLQKY